jgi:quercetin dioxygenase-like cupin family protein
MSSNTDPKGTDPKGTGPKGTDSAGAGPAPQLLADLDWCLAQARPEQSGALWRLEEPARQLDANLVRLPASAAVAAHSEPDVDVLLMVVDGGGTLETGGEVLDLAPHSLIWLPRGSRRAIGAGPTGLAYLTAHRARPGMAVRLPRDPGVRRRVEELEEQPVEQDGEAA